MNVIACIFIFFGICVTANAIGMQPDTSIHQIYVQLLYLTGVLLLVGGSILFEMSFNKKDK